MRKALALVALAVTSSAGAADDSLPSIFGQQLGAPVSLPECQRMVLKYPHPDGSPAPYTTEQPITCQQIPDSVAPETGVLLFTRDKLPAILKEQLVMTSIIDGRLNGIYAATQGYANADAILGQLTEKFGKPTSSDDEKVVIDTMALPGKAFEWDRPGYTVEYHTVSRNLGYGSLTIETTRARDARLQQQTDRDAQRTPL